MGEPAENLEHADAGFRRVLKNIGWLLGGKGFGAVCSLVYLAIQARSLGIKDFGHFSLIFGTAQAFVAIAGFQTWQTIVRFGAPLTVSGAWDRFGRLAVLGALIDFSGAIGGCLLAAIVFYVFGAALDLNPAYIDPAFLFVCALIWARGSAAVGILRVLDRYDLAVWVGAVTPAARLGAAVAIWLSGASVERFLLAWAVIEIATALLLWLVAWRAGGTALRLSHAMDWRTTLAEHPGIVRFLGINSLSTSVVAVLQQGPLLAVGYFLGTSAAGVYRIADQLAKGLSKLTTLIAQSLYPEVNRQRHSASGEAFRKLIRQINVMVLVAGVSVVALSTLLGPQLLGLIGGGAFARGGAILIPLSLGAAFELASVTYEPVLHASGHTIYPLYGRLLAVGAIALGIVLFVDHGPVAVGWVVAGGMAASYAALSAMCYFVLREMAAGEE
ncbi:oligosaccharide flippase family protein [Altererythrobacter aerius]|uniref:Oligosaccharide flippase family protein n=1 Tax=Tsuneonella aeria TaxID=1837929 RepID=A0A6I4TAL2_9SPHN|nr:lipopolysaccharide biosynthesis protein [Tsuneonella aeria]MXO74143.1 oligosaccharide flippase family protein [Tsuneonella aeria]